MDRAAVAVCLISHNYLASDFVTGEEVPYLLKRRSDDGMIVLPVLIWDCVWQAFDWISETQMLPRDGKSIAEDFLGEENRAFVQVAQRILKIVDDPDYKVPEPPRPRWSPPEKAEITRLPVTGAELFGRRKELALLDKAWESDGANVVSLVAWGGVGKSTLVNRWLERLEADNYRGARRVYGWSFYSQGTGERVTSADQFIAEALGWFGDPDPTAGSPWDKGQRLADLVRRDRTLLLLDGLEPLQSGLDYERGAIKDPALATLVTELAQQNNGMCLITTREAVHELARFPETTRQESLDQISAEAGRALLHVGGVRGADPELEQATRDFGLHALAVYLREAPEHHISNAAEIPDLDISEEEGKHPRRVMAAIADRFGDGPEIELLQVLGLFDRPAEGQAVAAVRAAPPIPGLTEHIQGLSEADWLRLVEKLRQAKLIALISQHRPDILDAHPLVREHFGEKLRKNNPDAWKEAHGLLYEHYKAQAPDLPDTLDEMAPLYAAVAHGCHAGRHQQALDDVYWPRVSRREEHFSWRQLGAVGADLAALSGFFDPPWRQPVEGLMDSAKAAILGWSGFRLRALGRLAEAAQPIQAGLEARTAQEDWTNAAIEASNLSELYLTLGDLAQSLAYGQKSVDLADRGGDAGQRLINRTTLANALYQAGRLAEAEALFREAEEMQKEDQHDDPFLYSLRGFLYCDLLLGQGQYREVQDRAGHTIEIARRNNWLLDIGLDYLSLGRGHLLEAQQEGTGELSRAADHLDRAVDGLRQAGTQDHLPRGLLARAALHRVSGDFERAEAALDQAMSIAAACASTRPTPIWSTPASTWTWAKPTRPATASPPPKRWSRTWATTAATQSWQTWKPS